MHVEALALLLFANWFFKSTKRNEGRWADPRRPDSHIPMSNGPLPSNKNEEEVFNPVHQGGRRHPDRRRNMFTGMEPPAAGAEGGSRGSSEEREAEEQQEREDAAERAREEEAAASRAREEAAARRAREEAEARRTREEAEARRAREEAAASRSREEREAAAQEQERARREREAAEERNAEEEEARRENEDRERQEQERREEQARERERQEREGSDWEAGDSDILLPDVQQAMSQELTQTCYAASSCTLAARTGFHLFLLPDQSPAIQNLHQELGVTLGALVDISQPRPRANSVVRALNDVMGREVFNLLVQECAGEFMEELIGRFNIIFSSQILTLNPPDNIEVVPGTFSEHNLTITCYECGRTTSQPDTSPRMLMLSSESLPGPEDWGGGEEASLGDLLAEKLGEV